MENKELLEMVRSKAQSWLTKSYDAETRAQVQALLDNEDPTELIESFYKDLEFGTGGLRGIMGVGSNRMNIYTVRHAGDAHYQTGMHRGEDLWEVGGFIVHFFSKEKVAHLAAGYNIATTEEF